MQTTDKIGLTVAFSIGSGITTIGLIRPTYVVSKAMIRPLQHRCRKRVGGYSLEEGEKATGWNEYDARPLNRHFGSPDDMETSAKKAWGRGGLEDSLIDTTFELRTMSNDTNAKGRSAD